MAVTSIVARTSVDGTHCWPDAPLGRGYLAARHRHLFKVEVWTPVAHDERDIEFHDLKAAVNSCIAAMGTLSPSGLRDFGGTSCEGMARTLAELLRSHGIRASRIVWSEDGEFDAVIEFNTNQEGTTS